MFGVLKEIWKKKDLSTDAVNMSVETLRKTFEMYEEVVKFLREREETKPDFDVNEEDKLINKSERSIRKKVVTHLLLSDKSEIAAGLTLVTIVNDIERIGDYTKNIADLAELHEGKMTFDKYEDTVKDIENRIRNYFVNTIKAFSENDKEAARSVMEDYKANVSGRCDSTQVELIRDMKGINKENAIVLALYLRHLKRVAAHLYNISTSVVNPFHRIGYKEKKRD